MPLSIDSRLCGKVFVIRCSGKICAGAESQTLEAAMTRAVQQSNRMVLEVSQVSRIDSSGMGLLVRFLSRIRNNGGDLRLAAPQPFFRSMLEVTKLSRIIRIYETEDEAIVSFLKEPAGITKEAAPAGPLVMFIDQSGDLCAFVRKLLNANGYEAITTCRLQDAKLLLNAAEISWLILGPDHSELNSTQALEELRPLMKNARLLQLQPGFKVDDVEMAASQLLGAMNEKADRPPAA